MMLSENRILLKRAGQFDANNSADYKVAPVYQSFEKALHMAPEAILEMIEQSGLRGRGGAGFPTGIKAQATSSSVAACMRFVVCNADEGEPGTFKDRVLMEQDPHLLIEGLLIAAFAVGAQYGYIYIRGEYFTAIEKVKAALAAARAANYIGVDIQGTEFSFDLEVMIGAGSYLCGEELTLLESLEGKRGYPRIKPPFPAEKGLWGQPTLVNNVETLANLSVLLDVGTEVYRSRGTEKSPGTKLVCVSGDIRNPGVYEVEMGCKIIDIIHDLAGGAKDGDQIQYVLLGGAAGTFASGSQLELPLCYDALKQSGLTLGSGAIMVYGNNSSLSATISSILHFFMHESCGKCVPCRVGTKQLSAAWENSSDKSRDERARILEELARDAAAIASSCLCPLGQSPVLPLASAVKNIINLLD